MAGDIVNLRGIRKAKRREEKEAQAAANRVRYGRSKAERDADSVERQRRERVLAGKRLEKPEES
jgi:hypothetical protein